MGSMNGALAPVMVLHDNPAARVFLTDNLTADGVATVLPSGSGDAVRLLAGPESPGVLVLAHSSTLRGRALWEVVELARAAGVPIVALTNSDAAPTWATVRLFEPFSYPNLRAHIMRLLEQSVTATQPRPAPQSARPSPPLVAGGGTGGRAPARARPSTGVRAQ